MPEVNDGPFVQAALICERALKEADGVTSLIRVVDRMIVGAVGPDVPDQMPRQQIKGTLVLVLKSGAALGSHTLRLTLEQPSGQSAEMGSLNVHFEGAERGAEVIANLDLAVEEPGLYSPSCTVERSGATRPSRTSRDRGAGGP